MVDSQFRTPIAENIFRHKYAQGPNDSWDILSRRLVEHVCGTNNGQYPHPLMSKSDREQLTKYIKQMKFIPGGRYLYYAGRPLAFFNNCFALKGEEDTREEWGNLLKRGSDALMSGGGIGVDYSIFREEGRLLKRTGGIASGPIPLMQSMNEMGRNVMQGGSRRSALFASLNWQHGDVEQFLRIKDWSDEIKRLKANDFNFPAPLDMTNISISWDDDFLEATNSDLWIRSVIQMCKTGEPGHCYNFGKNAKETLRNACAEFTAEEDSSVCNLGSINFGAIEDDAELAAVVELAAQFLYCGTIRGDLPYDKAKQVRDKNRDVGLGLMGLHEWLLKRGKKYEVDEDLKRWLELYQLYSEKGANTIADRFYLPRPRKYRAVAPAGTIGILASTTTGIEPLYAVAYKRRYLKGKSDWKYEYVIDATAQRIIEDTGCDPDSIETAHSLALDPERRVRFQYEVQKYVDMGISSTINLPAWGTEYNNERTAEQLAITLAEYCTGLRGITVYPDGARGGQPLTPVPYEEAINNKGVFDEEENKCSGGVCGV